MAAGTPEHTPPLPVLDESLIPMNLDEDQVMIYRIILRVRLDRDFHNKRPQPVVVFTDIGKDYDDLLAMILYKELHRLGIIELRGVIANLMPAKNRAALAHGTLRALGLTDIPVAIGTRGNLGNLGDKKHPVHAYEFDVPFISDLEEITLEGEALLYRLCEEALLKGENLAILALSSLTDVSLFAQKFPTLLKAAVSKVVLQGDYNIGGPDKSVLEPDVMAANNGFDSVSAVSFHKFMQQNQIPSVVYTKTATMAIKPSILPNFLIELANTGNPVGKHLYSLESRQDVEFYTTACNSDPKKRFTPKLDQYWFLTTRTTWNETEHPEDEKLPVGDEILQWVKVVPYDALAALCAGGDQLIRQLDVLTPATIPSDSIHQKVTDGKDGNSGVSRNMSRVLRALILGSLKAKEQNLVSTPPASGAAAEAA